MRSAPETGFIAPSPLACIESCGRGTFSCLRKRKGGRPREGSTSKLCWLLVKKNPVAATNSDHIQTTPID